MIEVLSGDALERLREMPEESVQVCVTSPPYWGLRDYGTAEWEGGDDSCDHAEPPRGGRNPETAGKQLTNGGTLAYQFAHECGKCGARRIDSQLGLERTPEEYVEKMVAVFREVRRVLRRDGTLWLNLGDSYAGGTQTGRNDNGRPEKGRGWAEYDIQRTKIERCDGLKPKDLVGIPWRVAFALQADGWWLRSDIIWAKPNPMPESVTDRPTKAHEYLFLLTKASSYFYDAEAIKEKQSEGTFERYKEGERIPYVKKEGGSARSTNAFRDSTPIAILANGRNKRSVWTVATAPYPEAHFATYPPDLIKPCIMAGTSAKGCCAKCGAPWERVVESERSRNGATPHVMDTTIAGNTAMQSLPSSLRTDASRSGMGTPMIKTLGWQPTCSCPETRRVNLNPVVPCTVLDPFAGSGTTGAVALELGRKAVLIELNPKYVELIEQRCDVTMGLALA